LASRLIGDVAGIEAGGELATVGDAATEDGELLLGTFEQPTATTAARRQAVRAIECR
jgi:hypothetical protein